MNKTSKLLALLLSGALMLGLASCGGGTTESKAPEDSKAPVESKAPEESKAAEESKAPEETAAPAAKSADDIPDSMTSADGKYQVAFITDVGQLKDKSFNQGTFDGVKLFADANGKSYKYYQPANGDQATDDDRYDAMKAAVDGGAEVVVCAGFMQGAALEKAAKEFPDTKFIFVDGWSMGLDNLVGITFKEHECGYMAGYAVVKEGYTKLGFSGGGGGDNPACCRYGYGYVQGANAAAAEMGVDVEINYSWQYGASFSASPELQTMISGWYSNGTEVVFAAGGSMFQSITAAAAANDGLVVGVDVDQSSQSDTVITSAMKGLSDATVWACGKAYDGTWAEMGGAADLGAADKATGLPTDTWMLENYSVEEYEAQLADIISGKLVIDNDYANLEQDWSNVKVNII